MFDTSLMTVEKRSEWFTDFAETLIRKNKGPLNFVLDEAHLFAPQAGARVGGIAPKMLHATNNLLALGRSKGLRVAMISQRPAKLHKDSLTQAHTLIAMMMTAPHDRRAVEDWIADQADEATGREIIASLASLAPGEGWIWAPRENVLERVKFSRPITFDSSSAPDNTDGAAVVLPSINPEAIKGKLADVAKDKAANDPAVLKTEVAKLRKELADRARETPLAAGEVQAAEERGFERGKAEVAAAADQRIREIRVTDLAGLHDLVSPLMSFVDGELRRAKAEKPAIAKSVSFVPAKHAPIQRQAAASAPAPRHPAPASTNGSGALPGPEQRIVDAIRWWNVLGIRTPSQVQVGFLAGYSHKSGTWATYLSKLRSAGMIEGRGDLVLTEEGFAISRPPGIPPDGENLRAVVMEKIDGPLRRILTPIIEAYPNAMSQTAAGEAAGYSSSSGTWATYLSKLRSLELIEGRGELKAQTWLFP